MAEAHLRWQADTAEAIAKTEALKRVVASVGGTSTTNSVRNLGAAWKVIIPAIVGAGVAVLGLTGNLAALAPLLPVVTAALAAFLAPFTTLAAMAVGFIPPLTLLVGLLGGLAAAFGLAGMRALKGGGIFKGFAAELAKVEGQFHDLVYTLGRDFLPIFMMLIRSASTALSYLGKIAKLPLKEAFQSLSTTGVQGFQKFIDKVGHVIAKPIRLAFQVAFGKSDTLRRALVDDWNDIVNFFMGHKGVLLPVQKWFGKQDFTAVGMRWATELAGALMKGLELALGKMWASSGGKKILIGGLTGALIGAYFGPVGALIGLAIGTAAGIALNHYWPQIVAEFHKLTKLLKQALGAGLWNQVISLAKSFWDTTKSIYSVVRQVFKALGGWHTVGVVVVAIVRGILGVFVGVATIVRIVYGLILSVARAIGRAAGSVAGAFQSAWNGVLHAVGAVASAISTIVGGIQTAIGAANTLANALTGGSSNGVNGTTGAGGGRFGGYRHRARGGPVTAGSSYMVGELGPELFTPGTSGMITPHGGGRTTQVNLVLDRRVVASVLVDADKTYRRQNAGRSLFAV